MVIMPHDLEVHMASSPAPWVARLLVVGQKWKQETEGVVRRQLKAGKHHLCVV